MKFTAISALCACVLVASAPTLGAAGQGAPGAKATTAAKTVPAAKSAAAAPTLERDPICGMSVDPAKATAASRTSVFKEKTFFFCSDNCKKQFDADPAKFAAQAVSGGGTSEMKGCCRCCGGMEAPAAKSGSSGGMCGRRMR